MSQRSPYFGRGSADLSRLQRERDLAAVTAPDAELVDVLVIGGGITGVGTALDAASRGLTVVLVEQDDLGSGATGTSGNSLARRPQKPSRDAARRWRAALAERAIVTHTMAPHLIVHRPEVMPIHSELRSIDQLATRVRLDGPEALSLWGGGKRGFRDRTRGLPRAEVLAKVPAVRRDGLTAGIERVDTELVDAARLLFSVARTAAELGARILTRVKVRAADGGSAFVEDMERGDVHEIRARAVINCTGSWADGVDPSITLRPSMGTFAVVRAERLGNPRVGLLVPQPGRPGRWIVARPVELGRVLIGPTDKPAPFPTPHRPRTSPDEVENLLASINRVLERPLSTDDVHGAVTALTVLTVPTSADGRVRNLSSDSADRSPTLVVHVGRSGMVTATGGSLSSFRLLAERAVDRAVRIGGLRAGPCKTRELPLRGAPGHAASAGVRIRDLGALPQSLVARFGAEAREVAASSLLDRPLEPVAPGIDVTRAEFSHFVRAEGATTVDDILARRTRIGLFAEDAAAARPAAEEALEVVGAHLEKTGPE